MLCLIPFGLCHRQKLFRLCQLWITHKFTLSFQVQNYKINAKAQNFLCFLCLFWFCLLQALLYKLIRTAQQSYFPRLRHYAFGNCSMPPKPASIFECDTVHSLLIHVQAIAYTCKSNCLYMYKQWTDSVESRRSPRLLRWIFQSKQMIYGHLLALGKLCASQFWTAQGHNLHFSDKF